MAGREQNPGFTSLGYSGQLSDAPRTAQAFQDSRSRYLEEANKSMGVSKSVELPAGPSTLDVELRHGLGRIPSFVVPAIEADGITLGSLVLSVQRRGDLIAVVRIESNLGSPATVELVAVILP